MMSHILISLFTVLVLAQPLFAFSMFSEIHHSNKFKTIQTEHFDIHYPVYSSEAFFVKENMARIAEKSAQYFEDAFNKLTLDLESTPYLRIQVVLIDNTDHHNGYATPVPQNMIYIYVVPPMLGTGLGEYDNWLRETATHELTHIINLSTVRGYSKVLRKIFGTVVSMNGTWPLNLIEGLAVFEETNMSEAGRGRSTTLHSLLRASEYDGRLSTLSLYSLDRTPYVTEEWPFGQVPYLYGYLLYEQVAKKYGRDVPGKISKHNSGVVPYFTDISFEKFSKNDIDGLWEDAIAEKSRFYRSWIDKIQSSGETKIENSFGEKSINKVPSVSLDGKFIAYHSYGSDNNGRIIVASLDGKRKAAFNSLDTTSIKWLNNFQFLYTGTVLERKTTFLGLYLYNLKANSSRLLDNSERVTAVEPLDALTVCTIRNKTGVNTLNIESINRGSELITEKTLYTSSVLARLSNPVYVKNGDMESLYFVEKEADAPNAIKYVDRNGKTKEIYRTESYIHSMSKDKNGNLIITDDRDGVSNVYSLNPVTKEIKKETNLVYGAFNAEYIDEGTNSKKYLVTYLRSDGYYLGYVQGLHSQVKPGDSKEVQKRTELPVTEKSKEIAYTGPVQDKSYTTFKTLLPKFWLPYMNIVDGGVAVGGMTYGSDPLFRSQYTVSGYYDTRTKKPGLSVEYTDQHFYPTMDLSAFTSNTWLADNAIMEEFDTKGTITVPFGRHLGLMTGLSYNYTTMDYISTRIRRNGIFGGFYITSAPITPTASISSSEKSVYADLLYYKYPKSWSSKYEEYDITSRIQVFIPLPFRHHVLAVNNDIGYSYGNPYRYFVGGGEFISFSMGSKSFLLRGFPVSAYYKRSLMVTNIEYRFPIVYINSGRGYLPLFLRRVHGALITDHAMMNREYSYHVYSVGAELRTDVFALYHIPVTLRLGLYKGNVIKQAQFFAGISMIF